MLHQTFPLRIVLVISLLALAPQALAIGIGISPAEFELENLPPGTEIKREILFLRGNPSEAQKANIVIEGTAAANIKGEKVIELPQGQSSTPYPFVISTGTLGEGTYEATIRILPIAEAVEGTGDSSGSRLVAGAQSLIRFVVTNELVQQFTIKDITFKEAEEGQPFGFTYLLRNDGNVDARPTKIEFSLVDKNDSENSYTETILEEALKPVLAFTEEEIFVPTKANMKTGLYTAHIRFFNGEEVIYDKERGVQILPQGTLAQEGKLETFTTNQTSYQRGELIKFNGAFTNTGEVGLSVSLVVEIIKGGKVVEIIKADPIYLLNGKSLDLESTYRLQDFGQYSARGFATYGPRHSNDITVSFLVKPSNTLMIIIFLTLVTAVFGAWIWRRHKKAVVS